MTINNEIAATELSEAKTYEELYAVLRKIYVGTIDGKTSDNLLQHHLEKLEVISSHLAVFSYGRMKMRTVRNNQQIILINICSDIIGGQLTVPKFQNIVQVWSRVMNLIRYVSSYDGDPQALGIGIMLLHRAAKILLEIVRESHSSQPSRMYYSQVENDFAKSLPVPILVNMPVFEQARALITNIDTVLLQQ